MENIGNKLDLLYAEWNSEIDYRGNCNNPPIAVIDSTPTEQDFNLTTPVTGQKGAMLRLLLRSIKLTDEDVYICSLFKQQGYKPNKSSIKASQDMIQNEIALVHPQFSLCFGVEAFSALMQIWEIKQTKDVGKLVGSTILMYSLNYLLHQKSLAGGKPRHKAWQILLETRKQLEIKGELERWLLEVE